MIAFYLQPAGIPAQETLYVWYNEASPMRHNDIGKVHFARIHRNDCTSVPARGEKRKESEKQIVGASNEGSGKCTYNAHIE